MWPPPLLQLGVSKGRATPLLKLIVTVDWLGKPKFGLKRGPTRTLVCCECKECSWNYTKLSYLDSSLPWTFFKWPLSFVCWICIGNLVHLNIQLQLQCVIQDLWSFQNTCIKAFDVFLCLQMFVCALYFQPFISTWGPNI